VRARCERTAVERRRATFDENADLGLAMRFLLVVVRRRRAIDWLCKPEAMGSNPIRSIHGNDLFAGLLVLIRRQLRERVRVPCERAAVEPSSNQLDGRNCARTWVGVSRSRVMSSNDAD